ncbi:tetratricopeptide repeat protein [Sphingomonas sp. KC8]|uniref:tetratricopeptide repeat protein n=1 Tax=Sphingomonas sp. KC8 TaxID=1030157 RepID=UPI0002488A23|nr:tetratricopeptide repeat protein [Sphingomonas sp. KC8]ARS27321.1 hypothetical protein KC8_08450 [Sphingomonas sp. KC8]
MTNLSYSSIRKLGLAAAVALSFALSACNSREERAAAAAATADQLLQQGNAMAASIEIRKALAERDDIAPYWLILARADATLQRYAGAYAAYLRVLELDRGNLEALHAVAELSFAGGQLDDADKYADQLLALNTQNVRALLVKGSVALKREKYDDATQFADQVLALDPGSEGAMLLRGRILSGQGKHAEAAALLEKSAAERGDTPATLAGLLEIYRKIDDSAGVARTFGRLFKVAPGNVDMQLDYARELYLNGDMRGGFAVVDKLQRAKPDDAGTQGRIVDIWLEVGGDAIPAEDARRIAQEGSPAMKVAMARYLLETGKPSEAERLLRPFVADSRIAAHNVEPHVIYALVQNALGKRDDALRRANAVLQFDETNPRALLLRTRIAIANGGFDRALADGQVLVRDNPDLATARVVLGQIYTVRGENGLANATFQQAIKDFPGNAEILSGYLDFLQSSGRRPEAIPVAAAFTRDNPSLVAGWKVRAGLCISVGEEECARTALTALANLRGGQDASRAMAGLLATRNRESAALSADVRAMADQVQRGQAGLDQTVGRLIAANRVQDADALVRFIIRREPRNSLAPAALGKVLLAQGKTDGAARQFRATIAKFPGQPSGYSGLATMLAGAGDKAGAYGVISTGLQRMRGEPTLLRDLADMQAQTGEPIKAIATYRSLLQSTPDDLIAINNLAALLTDYGQRPEALGEAELLAQRLAVSDTPAFFDTRGWLKLQRGEKAEAVRLLRRAVGDGRAIPVYRYHLAEALAATGDRGGAKAQVGQAIAEAQGNEPWLGQARRLMGRL